MVEITVPIQTTLIDYSMGLLNETDIIDMYARGMGRPLKKSQLTDIYDNDRKSVETQYKNDAAWQRYEQIREKYKSGEYKSILVSFANGEYTKLIDVMTAVGYDTLGGYDATELQKKAYNKILRYWKNPVFPYYSLVMDGIERSKHAGMLISKEADFESNDAPAQEQKPAKRYTPLDKSNQSILIEYAMHFNNVTNSVVIYRYAKARYDNFDYSTLMSTIDTGMFDELKDEIQEEVYWVPYLIIRNKFLNDIIKGKFEAFAQGHYRSLVELMQDIGFGVTSSASEKESERREYTKVRNIFVNKKFIYYNLIKEGMEKRKNADAIDETIIGSDSAVSAIPQEEKQSASTENTVGNNESVTCYSEDFYNELEEIIRQATLLSNDIKEFMPEDKIPTTLKQYQKMKFIDYMTDDNLEKFKSILMHYNLIFKAIEEFNETYGRKE